MNVYMFLHEKQALYYAITASSHFTYSLKPPAFFSFSPYYDCRPHSILSHGTPFWSCPPSTPFLIPHLAAYASHIYWSYDCLGARHLQLPKSLLLNRHIHTLRITNQRCRQEGTGRRDLLSRQISLGMGRNEPVAWEDRYSLCGQGNEGQGNDEVQKRAKDQNGLRKSCSLRVCLQISFYEL